MCFLLLAIEEKKNQLKKTVILCVFVVQVHRKRAEVTNIMKNWDVNQLMEIQMIHVLLGKIHYIQCFFSVLSRSFVNRMRKKVLHSYKCLFQFSKLLNGLADFHSPDTLGSNEVRINLESTQFGSIFRFP